MDGIEIGVTDYKVFENGSSTSSTLRGQINDYKEELTKSSKELNDESVFKGPICDNCIDAIKMVEQEITSSVERMDLIKKYLSDVYTSYKNADYQTLKSLLLITGTEGTETTEAAQANSNTGKVNQDYIYNYLANKGFSKAAICGILANIEYESGFKTTIKGDKGTSYGICQWHNERWTRLKNYCKENNLDSSSIEGQTAFLEHELKTYYPKLYNKLKSIPNTKEGAYQAAALWTTDFERPANASAQAKKRGNAATNSYWTAYMNL